jgi:hypothetical protein
MEDLSWLRGERNPPAKGTLRGCMTKLKIIILSEETPFKFETISL